MEGLLVVLAVAFGLLPLPLCIFLIVRTNRQDRKIRALEDRIHALPPSREHAKPATGAATAETPKAPSSLGLSEAKIVFHEEKSAPTPPPIPVNRTAESASGAAIVSPPQSAPPIKPLPKARLVPLLRSFGLWPPEDLARRESGLIQWWFPRIGGLFAVLTVIFVAVYISRGSPPWVKWIRLMVVDAAVIGGGIYFLRKPERKRFGSNLLSIGLSMTYVSVVAGYAAPPVRIFENPLIGIAAQFLCVIGIFGASIALRDRSIGIMASVFGYASSLFSAYVGWNEGALLSAFILQLAGMATGYRLNSRQLVSIASIGVYIPVAAFCGFKAIHSQSYTLPDSISVLAFLCVSVSALPLVSSKARLAERFSETAWRFLHGANTTLCLAIGYAYFSAFTIDLTQFYGAMGLLFAIWAALFLKQGLRSLLFQLFFIKASGLAALWAANHFHGDLRWFALIVDAVIVAFVARISLSKWKEVASLALWAIAILLSLGDSPSGNLDPWTIKWALYISLPLLGIAGQAYLLPAMARHPFRSLVYTFAALANGALLTAILFWTNIQSDSKPAYLAIGAVAAASIGFIPRVSIRIAAIAAAIPILSGHIGYWLKPYNEGSLLCLLSISLVGAFLCARSISRRTEKRFLLPEWSLLSLSSVTLIAYLNNGFTDERWYPYIFPLLAIAALGFGKRPFQALSDTLIIPIVVHIILATDEAYSLLESWIILILYALLLAWIRIRPESMRFPRLLRKRHAWIPITHSLVALLVGILASNADHWFDANCLLTISGFGFFGIWKAHRHRSALAMSAALVAAGVLLTAYAGIGPSEFEGNKAPWGTQVLLIGIIQMLGLVGCGVILHNGNARRIAASAKTALLYCISAASFSAIAFCLSYDGIALDSYYTPLIALYCLALVSIGIALKIKPFRMVAIIGFLLPVGRLFVYDIKETLYRIIAFAALAVLLTFIGYLYNRFASRIE